MDGYNARPIAALPCPAMTHVHDLPDGRLTLTIDRADLPPDELFAIGARANPRRAFLFVSKVLGKHWPVATTTLARIHQALAAKLPDDLPAPVLFIGMAETATALAQGVFEAWLARAPQSEALYLHTSRLRVAGAETLPFAESHSHASQQWLHLPDDAENRRRFHAARSLVLIDDELSTGDTFRALTAALTPHLPALQHTHWLCLTNFSPATADTIPRHSLLRGSWQYHAQRTPPAAAATAERAITITDSGHGRLGIRHALQLPKALLARHSIRAGARVLVLGTGEYIHPPAVYARELARRSGAQVWLQSSTRSPAHIWGALSHKRDFADPYDAGVPYYLYNLPPAHDYDHIHICHEHPANPALRDTAAALGAQLVQLTQP